MQHSLFKILFIAVILFLKLNISISFAQNRVNIDSLEQALANSLNQEQPDSTVNMLLLQIFNYYENNQWGKAVDIAKQGIALFKTSNFNYCKLWHEKLGFLYLSHDIYQLALNTYFEGFSLAKEMGMPLGACYNNLARVYLAQNLNLNKAAKLYLQAIEEQKKILNELEQLKQLAYSYNQLGIVYERQKKYDDALNLYRKALKIRKEINDSTGLVNSLYTIAFYYNTNNNYDSAIIYFDKGLSINKNNSYKISLLTNRAVALARNKEYTKAHNDIRLAQTFANKNSTLNLGRIYEYESKVYHIEGNLAQAINSATKALEIANKYNHSALKLEILPLLSGYYEERANYKKANFYQNEYIELTKIKNKEKNKIIENSYAKKEDDIINTLQKNNTELEKHNKLLYLIVFVSTLAFVLLAILFIILYSNKKKLARVNEEIRVHAVIAKLLGNITGKQRTLEVFLQDALEEILKIPWLKFAPRGSIFITNKNGDLEMIAHKNLKEPLLKNCAIVKSGECLCGKAMQEKKMLHCTNLNETHEVCQDGVKEHGLYNMPILFHGDVIGVLNLYLNPGHKKQDYELEFLETISKTLASVINRKTIQVEFSEQAKGQEKLNQKLFAQTLEVEQRNVEIKQFLGEQEKLNQKLFAQKMEVEQRNSEIQQISKKQEETNQKLFAQKMEVEQRNIEIQKYSDEQDKLNQKFFAQTLELDQRNIEIKRYSDEIEKQKDLVESAHKDVTDSISYAQTIQSALLPTDKQVKLLLNDYFILFKPRDVVSGDFYYVTEAQGYIVFAVADCTGHGVPGGFLTMLGISFINDIIKRQEVNTPAEALEQLRINVKGVFERQGEINHNGLDIALCAIDKESNTLTFSGAYSSLYLIRNGELIEYKATKNPIGWHPKELPFKNHTIKLQNNDLIYLFSDGYHDQFGLNNRKFLKKRFKLLLQEIKDMPMDEQKTVLEGIFDKWKTNSDQTDDVTIMAVRWHM